MTPEVYYSKRSLGCYPIGLCFQCLAGVARGREKLWHAISPLNLLSSATAQLSPYHFSANHGSYLPPGLCLSSLHTWTHQPQWCQNELLKIGWTCLLPADMYLPVLKVQLSYRSNQFSLHSCQPHFLAFVNLRLWLFPEHAMSFHAFPSDRSILCLLISVSDWVSHIYFVVSLTLWRPFRAFSHSAKIILPFLVPHTSFDWDVLKDRVIFFLPVFWHAVWTW